MPCEQKMPEEDQQKEGCGNVLFEGVGLAGAVSAARRHKETHDPGSALKASLPS